MRSGCEFVEVQCLAFCRIYKEVDRSYPRVTIGATLRLRLAKRDNQKLVRQEGPLNWDSGSCVWTVECRTSRMTPPNDSQYGGAHRGLSPSLFGSSSAVR
ncbi:hypothetical protein NPIL_412021 [Nephila pilipes]|uniref:Uncharacterized protein n=1 Tax=Nephila pilipes TaxID=299642 RepID=A0A8X6P4B8_NEPPI|nr:hypothetical protein NPIL_412021 [Nephila pilipes]